MTELDLSYYLNDDISHSAEGLVARPRLPDYGAVVSRGSGSVLLQNTFKILECESKEFTRVREDFDGRGDTTTVEEYPNDPSTLNITEPDSSLTSGVLHPVEKQKQHSELPSAGTEKSVHMLNVVDGLESDDESLLDSQYHQKTYQDFLKDAVDSKINGSQFQQLPFVSLFPSDNGEFVRESTFSAEDLSFHSDNDKLFNPLLSSFNFPKHGSEPHGNEKVLGHDDCNEETGCVHVHRGIDVLTINSGMEPTMSESSIEPKLLTKAMNECTDFENLEEGVSESSSSKLRKEEEENKKRAERRIKEAAICHNDFAPLEEGMLFHMFYLPSPKSKKGSSTRRKRRSRKKTMKSEGKTDIAHGLLVSLYTKDTVISYQTEKSEQEEGTQAGIDLKNPEEWLCTLNSAFDIDDDILGEMNFDPAEISTLLTALESLGDVLLSNDITETDAAKPCPNVAVSPAGTTVLGISQNLSEKALDPPAAPSSAISLVSSRLNEKQEPETVIDVIMSSPGTELAMSPPGTLTAFLYPKYDPEGRTNKKNQSLFHEGIHSVLTKGDQCVKSIGSSVPDEVSDSRFVCPPTKPSRKRQRSFRKILFAKSPLLRKSSDSEKSNRILANAEVEDLQSDRKSGTIISLKSLWRFKLISHSTSMSRFNLESGESLDEYVADYVGHRDLRLPRYGDMLSKGGEAAKKMMLDGCDPISVLGPDSRESDDSDDTLTSFVADKLHAGDSSVLEYSPTPGPVVSKSYQFDKDNRWFGLRRFKTMGHMKKHPAIRFAQEPTYITEPNLYAIENSDDTSEGDSGHTRSILKRRTTLGKQKRRFRYFFYL
jgi:hypothetical protein